MSSHEFGRFSKLSVAFFLGASLSLAQPAVSCAQGTSSNEPIAFIGHGAIFGPGGNEIAPTARFLGDALVWYIDELTRNLPSDKLAQFEEVRRSLLDGMSLDEQSRLIVQTRLIDWLLDRTTRGDADQIRAKINLVKWILTKQLTNHSSNQFPRGTQAFTLSAETARRLGALRNDAIKDNLLSNPSLFDVTVNSGEEYRKECASKGVPLPPNFGAGSGWEDRGVIPKSELFIVRGADAKVLTWTSPSPKGLCIALPRYGADKDKTVGADGIICMGQESSNVCFFDNQVKGGTFDFPLDKPPPIEKWAGGVDLQAGVGGVCTDCHAGENPYIIHGKLLLSLAEPPLSLPTTPKDRYNPIVRSTDIDTSGQQITWPQNTASMDAPAPCVGCHGTADTQSDAGRLPRLSSALPKYCKEVLRSSIGALMPPPRGNLNPPPSMPQGSKAGTLACTPGLPANDPRYAPCSAKTTFDCTPIFSGMDPIAKEPDFPGAYKVSCTKEMYDLLKMCEQP
jgi:hypothetical protein